MVNVKHDQCIETGLGYKGNKLCVEVKEGQTYGSLTTFSFQ